MSTIILTVGEPTNLYCIIPLDSWFIQTPKVKDRLLELNSTIGETGINRYRKVWKMVGKFARLEFVTIA